MGLSIDNVHVLQRIEGTNQVRIIKRNPYVRFVRQGAFPVLVQGGRFYTDGGDVLIGKEIPDWVLGEIKKMTPEGRRNVGLPLDGTISPSTPSPSGEDQNLIESESIPVKEETKVSVVDVVYSLDPRNDDLWTGQGAPDLRELRRQTGTHWTRAEVDELTNEYRRPSTEGGEVKE